MYRDIWINCHSSICSISFFNQDNFKIGSGSGFKVGNYLVTNNHVFTAPGSANVELSFVNIDGHTTKAFKIITYPDFQARLESGLPENSWDFAILRLNDSEFNSIPSLTLADSNTLAIGQRVAILGFQFEQTNLSIKQGILSSKYVRSSVKYLQIDASVNSGNSGGPLINADNNRVVGMVTRKHTGLTQAFDDLIRSFDDNIAALQPAKGLMTISGFDHVEALIATQHQMKGASRELHRSSNVGIGFAYELEHVKDFFDHL